MKSDQKRWNAGGDTGGRSFRSQLKMAQHHMSRYTLCTFGKKLVRTKTCGALFFLLFISSHGWKVYYPRVSSPGHNRTHVAGTIWSSDFHISPVADIKSLLRTWDKTSRVFIIDESLSGHCAMTDTCAQNLQVLTRENGITLGDCPNELKREFWKMYHARGQFEKIDAFLFTYSSGLSELFMAFGKPLIIVASVRYEVGRLESAAWEKLNLNLRNIAMDKRNTIAANNRYDLEYLKHFTGLTNIKLLPNLCDYVSAVYNRTRAEILIGPSRHSQAGLELIHGTNGLFDALKQWSLSSQYVLKMHVLRDLYPKYDFSDIAAHPAVVIIPYANSVMSVIEYYRMGIPIFAPSVELLTKWQVEKLILDELSWACIHGHCSGPSTIQPHNQTPHHGTDPNNLTDHASMLHWLQFADFYNWPAVQYYHSWEDLFQKLASSNLDQIHSDMMVFNTENLESVRIQWLDVLQRALHFDGSPSLRQNKPSVGTWEQAVRVNYPHIPQVMVDSRC